MGIAFGKFNFTLFRDCINVYKTDIILMQMGNKRNDFVRLEGPELDNARDQSRHANITQQTNELAKYITCITK